MATLTNREREVVELLAQGYTIRHISDVLHIEYDTARRHIQNAREKTQSSSTFDLAVKAAIQRAR